MKPKRHRSKKFVPAAADFVRLDRAPTLTARVEQMLRHAIQEGRFPEGRLPTEMELAEQLGVSRETVRLAAEVLQREGLLVKVRRRGTFLESPALPDVLPRKTAEALGFFQASYASSSGQEEEVTRVVSGLMMQGALEEAGHAGFRLVAQNAPHTRIGQVFQNLTQAGGLRGAIFASYGEEKLLRRAAGLGLPIVLLDHDVHLSHVHSVRDDSFQGARDAVRHLVSLGHRRIGFVNWHQQELNPWRLRGYREGMREAGLSRRRGWEISVALTSAGALQAVAAFLALPARPTALYCFNNTLARLLMEQLQRQGLAIPEEVSVLGGGGEDVPGLACHQADWYQLGRIAVRILLQALKNPDSTGPEHHLGPHSLRGGPTVGRCAKNN